MARAPLMQLSGIRLGFGGRPLIDDASAVVHEGDRLALVGRNGSGKSTLLGIMAGRVEPDGGSVTRAPGLRIGLLAQRQEMDGHETLGDWITAGLPEGEGWRGEALARELALDLSTPAAAASGGEARKAALVRCLAEEPDLLLLDEPTNHLDVATVAWLERHLAASRAAMVLISHDRALLHAVVRGILWLDRGVLRRLDRPFAAFDDWRGKVWAEEERNRARLEKRIHQEARWAVEGISARRRRNQGRLRRLEEMRAARREMLARPGVAALALEASPEGGRLVIEAREIEKSFDGRRVLRPFSLRVMRGDRVALVGPNGAGKTTLLRLLTGELAPDAGRVRHGTRLEIASLDQGRRLDPDATLWETLTLDPELGVQGRSDRVMVRGRPRHVIGYLRDFLFSEEQARAPVRTLSGGERARLLLARIMARPANLLVLDEPTNDLDVETLELLEDVLAEHEGTVLLVSHDRAFVDAVATTTLAFEGDGRISVHAGGWSDLPAELRERLAAAGAAVAAGGGEARPRRPRLRRKQADGGPGGRVRPGLSFTERHRLAILPEEIARLEAEIARLEELLADPELYARDPARFEKAGRALAARQEALAAAEEEWLALAERAEAAGETPA